MSDYAGRFVLNLVVCIPCYFTCFELNLTVCFKFLFQVERGRTSRPSKLTLNIVGLSFVNTVSFHLRELLVS